MGPCMMGPIKLHSQYQIDLTLTRSKRKGSGYLQPAHGAVGVEQVEHLLVEDLVERAAAQVLDAAAVAPLLPVCSKTMMTFLAVELYRTQTVCAHDDCSKLGSDVCSHPPGDVREEVLQHTGHQAALLILTAHVTQDAFRQPMTSVDKH